ncbi:MAG: IMP dehydrogenase [Proteobacteria bacterium]|nr:IMP dehydrogenase [Pseudomonadota bacterium]MCH9758341.1 IMP dehydrogenase [Pseudomonadota bacterium]
MRECFTFDDVLLEPRYSSVLPAAVDVNTSLARGFPLALPILSAAMDTVTESKMAIAIAQAGGLGVIHKNLSPENQADELEKVKRFESGIVYKPLTVTIDKTVADVRAIQEKHGFSGVPVVDTKNRVQGIVTNRDVRFETRMSRPLSEIMTPKEKLITVAPGFKLRAVKALLQKHRIERVVIIDAKGVLRGLMTVKDILRSEQFPHASKDKKGRLRAAAAVGVNDLQRAMLLVEAGADALVLDSAHGHSLGVLEGVAELRRAFPKLLLIAGNVATTAGASALVEAGADVLKVGIGPGSICTTRVVAGVGVPQITAIQQVAAIKKSKKKIKIIADGGMRYSGDIAKAIAVGADVVMVGGMLAGTEETPGEIELYQGRAYKRYRGMGSVAAMRRGSSERYFQDNNNVSKMVPEGVEGRVPFKGKVNDVLHQLVGGLRASMGYVGAPDIPALQKAKLLRITNAGMRESHVHDVEITREAPNYQVE